MKTYQSKKVAQLQAGCSTKKNRTKYLTLEAMDGSGWLVGTEAEINDEIHNRMIAALEAEQAAAEVANQAAPAPTKKTSAKGCRRVAFTLKFLGLDAKYVKVDTAVGVMRFGLSRAVILEQIGDLVTVEMTAKYAAHRNLMAA